MRENQKKMRPLPQLGGAITFAARVRCALPSVVITRSSHKHLRRVSIWAHVREHRGERLRRNKRNIGAPCLARRKTCRDNVAAEPSLLAGIATSGVCSFDISKATGAGSPWRAIFRHRCAVMAIVNSYAHNALQHAITAAAGGACLWRE